METDNDTSNMEPEHIFSDETKSLSPTKALNNSKESDGENVEAIRKYIEEQEKEIEDQRVEEENKLKEEVIESKDADVSVINEESQDEKLAVASCMMDVILSESEARLAKKQDEKSPAKQSTSLASKGNSSMALSVGSKVEAKDFGEYWYPAEIVEVDYDEMEVLVRYDDVSKKHDEWISVSSPRLRPFGSSPKCPPPPENLKSEMEAPQNVKEDVKEELKTDEKPKISFSVGERCLARWRDNRRFIATISSDLGDGNYEILFDDGFHWKCSVTRLHKYKDNLSVDTTSTTNSSVPSPIQHGGPSTALAVTPALFHTHLFDPNRDYLSSKSERREMKRKLNIKEIFNIGQKRKKVQDDNEKPLKVVKKKPKEVKKKTSVGPPVESTAVLEPKKEPVKNDVPEAVASIIGTVKEERVKIEVKEEPMALDAKVEDNTKENVEAVPKTEAELPKAEKVEAVVKNVITESNKCDEESGNSTPEEEMKLEKFEKQDEVKHGEVIDKIKEVITKIEDDLNKVERTSSPKVEVKEESVKTEDDKPVDSDAIDKDKSKKVSKVKKSKKLRLLQEKKVKRQVEKVKSELEEMKKQVEEMRKQMMMKTEELEGHQAPGTPLQMPESFLLPGEWCCKWVDGQPVGKVSELDAEVKDGNQIGLPRRSVQVEDKRLPEGWTKHMVRRSLGHSAGKWDIVLISPDNKRFHTKLDMRNYLENNPDIDRSRYEHALMDFGVHLKLSRRMGWYTNTPGGVDNSQVERLPAGTLSITSPLVKRRKLSLNNKEHKVKDKKKRKLSLKPSGIRKKQTPALKRSDANASDTSLPPAEPPADLPLEDGFVYVGSLKVQIIDNLLRCPAEGCLKNFRNNTLLQMHIKHYHRELRKKMGKTPKVSDLAYARTMPVEHVEPPPKRETGLKTVTVKLSRLPKRLEQPKQDVKQELHVDTPTKEPEIPKQDSPKLRNALANKPVKRPKVLLPVRRVDPEPEPMIEEPPNEDFQDTDEIDPSLISLDFETAISTHTVTKPLENRSKEKKFIRGPMSEDDDWFGANSDMETRSSLPRSCSPDSKYMDQKAVSSESNEEQKEPDMYMYTENGERIKIVHMKREEIINCHCGIREEDGLMVQCELCLCWQHALCHNIQKESEVPEKYTCSICLNPRRGRRSKRFLHDQDRLYEGLLPGAKPCESLRRSHELSGNLLRIQDALHALRVKYHVATKKDHPKLYLWAKDWEASEISFTQEKLNSDYSGLNIMINNIGKENLPVRVDDMRDVQLDVRIDEEHDRFNHRDSQLGPQMLLSGLLSSPGGGSLDLPISTSDLEKLAKSVQEQETHRGVIAPQPEAAIENSACRERLLRHIQRCQALIDARLDSIEAQVAELESQDPSFEDDETADYFPRTKQTIQMLMRDLDTMEELGAS